MTNILKQRIAQRTTSVDRIVRLAQDFEMASRGAAFGMGAGSSRMDDSRTAAKRVFDEAMRAADTETLADFALIAGSAIAAAKLSPLGGTGRE